MSKKLKSSSTSWKRATDIRRKHGDKDLEFIIKYEQVCDSILIITELKFHCKLAKLFELLQMIISY